MFKVGDLVTFNGTGLVFTVEAATSVQEKARKRRISDDFGGRRGEPEVLVNGRHFYAAGGSVFKPKTKLVRWEPGSPVLPSTEPAFAAAQLTGGRSEGVKHDSGKQPWDLLSVCAMDELLAVLDFGKQKYAAHNWRNGFKWSRLIAAAARHLFAFMRGEDRDPETGLLHPAHLMCCAMFLTEHVKRKLGEDDRYKETT